VLGPTEVFGHETMNENMTVKGSPREIIFITLAVYAWAAHETILLVCLGHIQKMMQAINEFLGISVGFVHIHYRSICIVLFQKIKLNSHIE